VLKDLGLTQSAALEFAFLLLPSVSTSVSITNRKEQECFLVYVTPFTCRPSISAAETGSVLILH